MPLEQPYREELARDNALLPYMRNNRHGGNLHLYFQSAALVNVSQTRRCNQGALRRATRIEKKLFGYDNIPLDGWMYNEVMPLNTFWTDYVCDLLNIEDSLPEMDTKEWELFTAKLYKADLHGSYLRVVESKCPSYVFKEGICIMDRKNTIKILSANNSLTTLPKKECIFELKLKQWRVQLYGKYFRTSIMKRTSKKMKNYLYPEL